MRLVHRIASPVLLSALLIPWPDPAQAQDIYGSTDEYDGFAVGAAHRWYDNHASDAKQKSSDCLSLLDEAKAFQDRGLALFDEATRPGNSRRQSALVKQANRQMKLRGEKLRAFKDCVNQAIRADRFASSGESGGKGVTRVKDEPAKPDPTPAPITLDKAVDDCFAGSLPDYRSPDWGRFSPEALRPRRSGQFDQSFIVSAVAAEQALYLDELVNRPWIDRELMRDYLVGWLTRCLTERKLLPEQDPRMLYRRFIAASDTAQLQNRERIDRRFEEFGFGYRMYPRPPLWDQDRAGAPPP